MTTFLVQVFFGSTVCSLLSKKRDKPNLKNGFISSFLGISLITIVLLKSKSVANFDIELRQAAMLWDLYATTLLYPYLLFKFCHGAIAIKKQ